MFEHNNLIDYLVANSDLHSARYLGWMRYEISKKIYYFGKHFKYATEGKSKGLGLFKDYAEYIAIMFSNKTKIKGKKILSSAYSLWNDHFDNLGFDTHNPPWNFRRNGKVECSFELYLLTKRIKRCFEYADFNYLISNEFISLLNKHEILFKEYCISNSFEALIVPNDVGYFEKLAVCVFRELGKPSFVWAHGGMPNIYDGKIDNRTDFSVHWGQMQADAYVKMGYSSSKMLVSGHHTYTNSPEYFKFEFNEILVLTKSLNGTSPLETPHVEDRGNAILYLHSIQKVLQKLGVNQVRLRPHPSESDNWYKKYIDNSFFIQGESEFVHSLKNSSLVIGPISTSFIDSLHYGVNYVVYEPIIDNLTLMGFPVAPPLDGLDSRIPIARSESDLEIILSEKQKVDINIYKEFVKTPMDISFLTELI